MLYNVFKEFLEDINEDVLPNDLTGYRDSLIWQKLYNFQRDAATGIINKLETYSGCILADSVGLGKPGGNIKPCTLFPLGRELQSMEHSASQFLRVCQTPTWMSSSCSTWSPTLPQAFPSPIYFRMMAGQRAISKSTSARRGMKALPGTRRASSKTGTP